MIALSPYVPDVLASRLAGGVGPGVIHVDGTLCSVDISGFTRLSEDLAELGKEGAESLTEIVGGVFARMIDLVAAYDGQVLSFGGDALLILHRGYGHVERSCQTALAVREVVRDPVVTPTGRSVQLQVSTGIHAGQVTLFDIASPHRSLIAVGPAATATVAAEGCAEPGQIIVSHPTAAVLPADWLGPEVAVGRVLDRHPADVASPPLGPPPTIDLSLGVPPGVRRHLLGGGTQAEHRIATVAFVQFTGIDDLVAREGADQVHQHLATIAETVADEAEAHGVHWLATDTAIDGGKIILAAGAPTSSGHDEAAIIQAMRNALDRLPGRGVSVGVNRGRIFAGDVGGDRRRTYTVMGDAVNLAARLMGKADVGEVIVSRETLDWARLATRGRSLEPFLVKGKRHPIDAVQVDALAGPAPRKTGRAHDLVGRDDLLRRVTTMAEAQLGSDDGPVILHGERGVGKTRLLDEVRTGIPRARHVVLEGAAHRSSVPWYPVAQMLREIMRIDSTTPTIDAGHQLAGWLASNAPGLAEDAPFLAVPLGAEVPDNDRWRATADAFRGAQVQRAVIRLLDTVTPRATLFVVDNTECLDEATSAFVTSLVRAATTRPWALVIACMPDLSSIPDEMWAEGTPLPVPPIEDEAAARLVIAAADRPIHDADVTRIVGMAANNPLFLIEYARVPVDDEDLPETLEVLLRSNLDALSPDARSLVQAAAVVGEEVDLATLVAVLQSDVVADDAMWDVVDPFLVRLDDQRAQFRHPVFQRVAYEALPFRVRRLLHGRAAMSLMPDAPDRPGLATRLAGHASAARMHDIAWIAGVRAGDQARQQYANTEAAHLYRVALEHADELLEPPPDVAAVAERWGDAAEQAGRLDIAEDAYQRARVAARSPLDAARLKRKLGILRDRQARYPSALSWFTRAGQDLADLTSDEAVTQRAELDLAIAGVRFRQGRFRECRRRLATAIQHATATNQRALLGHAYHLLDLELAYEEGAPDEPIGRSLRIYEEIGDLVGQANTLNNLGINAYFAGHWDRALRLYDRSRVARQQAGDAIGEATQRHNLGELLCDLGRLDEAAAELEAASRAFRASGFRLGIASATMNLGRVAQRRGDTVRAESLLRTAVEDFGDLGTPSLVVEAQVRLAEVLAVAGRHDECRELATMLQTSGRSGNAVVDASLLRVQAMASWAQGDTEDARRQLAAALALAVEGNLLFERALLLEALARTTLDAPAEADALADRARADRELLGIVSLDGVALPPQQSEASVRT